MSVLFIRHNDSVFSGTDASSYRLLCSRFVNDHDSHDYYGSRDCEDSAYDRTGGWVSARLSGLGEDDT